MNTQPNNTPTSTRIKLRLLVVLAAILMVFFPLSAHAGDLDDALLELTSAEAETQVVVDERASLEKEYRSLTREIESLKGNASIVNESELQAKLTSARSMAENLNELSDTLRLRRKAEEPLRTAVVAAYDELIRSREAKLLNATTPEAQAAAIGELESLQKEREAVRSAVALDPLEPIDVPDLSAFDSSDPDEILAAADELADNEEQLERQLGAVDDRIATLEKRRRLVAYAEDSADQVNLFGEESRGTRVSGSSGGSATRSTTDKTNSGASIDRESGSSPINVPSTTGGGGTQAESQAPADPSPAPPENTDGDASDDATDSDGDGLFAAGEVLSDSESRTDSLANFGTVGGSETGGDAGPAIAPPASSGTGITRSDADTNDVAGGTASSGGRTLNNELNRLKRHRKKLNKSLGQVRRQKKKLRSQAKTFN